MCIRDRYQRRVHGTLSGSPECKRSGTYTIGNLGGDCQRYLKCVDGRAYERRCVPGTFFNTGTGECQLGNKADICGSQEMVVEYKTNPTSQNKPTSATEFNTLCANRPGRKIAWPGNNCAAYIECDRTQKRAIKYTCNSGLEYSPGSGSCVSKGQASCPYQIALSEQTYEPSKFMNSKNVFLEMKEYVQDPPK
eukprot:TRINITY_DN1065_c0_g1_i9.p2 TRINITY_DN1065_c0_g1~~TRINITY_DN1065_c0_g1_i9.p2  ORF type:complete len:219 (+),score=57.73 TRINITY_DN1065_c0_g1_i9:79-657(+)